MLFYIKNLENDRALNFCIFPAILQTILTIREKIWDDLFEKKIDRDKGVSKTCRVKSVHIVSCEKLFCKPYRVSCEPFSEPVANVQWA